jgi:hypothetical protein
MDPLLTGQVGARGQDEKVAQAVDGIEKLGRVVQPVVGRVGSAVAGLEREQHLEDATLGHHLYVDPEAPERYRKRSLYLVGPDEVTVTSGDADGTPAEPMTRQDEVRRMAGVDGCLGLDQQGLRIDLAPHRATAASGGDHHREAGCDDGRAATHPQ